eukprot:GILI01020277.1.p1 GENE.GILI01020277.1~~GILI01020277.1.p1  ORF type:complete len:156 (+),score=27.19 GILI01020277.1:83-550(+)
MLSRRLFTSIFRSVHSSHLIPFQPSSSSLLRYFSASPAAASSDSASPAGDVFRLSDKCVAKLKELGGDVFLRVTVDSGGCSGYKYDLKIDSNANPEDIRVERDGACVITDRESLPFVMGATIDYQDEMIRSGFLVASNPNADSSCGCKSSFAAKF